MNQTPLLLALIRGDLDLNEIIKFMVKKLGYIDDLTTVVFPKEIEALQKELFPYMHSGASHSHTMYVINSAVKHCNSKLTSLPEIHYKS